MVGLMPNAKLLPIIRWRELPTWGNQMGQLYNAFDFRLLRLQQNGHTTYAWRKGPMNEESSKERLSLKQLNGLKLPKGPSKETIELEAIEADHC